MGTKKPIFMGMCIPFEERSNWLKMPITPPSTPQSLMFLQTSMTIHMKNKDIIIM